MKPNRPLLSIAIPAYNRPQELKLCIQRFIAQIRGRHEDAVEIVISDDASPDDALREVRELAASTPFIRFRRYESNIGLEHNLIACSEDCTGEFLWLFGDDDFLEPDDALDTILGLLRAGEHDFYILNRTRRSFDLTKLISDNWMRLKQGQDTAFAGLRDFCMQYGFISVIGFISVNIFRRAPFQAVDATRYFGTMYPQLDAMLEAFHSRPTLLVAEPLVCHRTQTMEEKRAALGTKPTEAAFMANVRTRDATYFSHPYVAMLAALVRLGAFAPKDIVRIPENTVINGLLVDFLIQTVELSHQLKIGVGATDWAKTELFFAGLPLDAARRQRVSALFAQVARPPAQPQALTVSVVTPSFNQAEFLHECLTSVRVQSHAPIEHLVYDPGSRDDSREIAASYAHVTLFPEPDSGQSDALNKGFAKVRGDIVAWVNSDDCFADPDVFRRVVERFSQPDAPDIVYGRGIYTDENGRKLRDVYVNKSPDSLHWRFQQEDGILQPALFMRRSVVERVGPLRNDLHYCMDYEYWIRCLKAGVKFAFIDDVLAVARYHSNNKTYGMRGKSYSEVCDMMKEHFGYVNHVWLMRYAEFLAEGHDGVLAHAANVGIKDTQRLDEIYRGLLRDYNATYDTHAKLAASAAVKGYGDTYREMNRLGIGPAVPCHPIPLEQATAPGCVTYTVGPRRWAYDAKWKAAQIARTHDFFRRKMNERRGDTCVIVGNGPSLNKTDLSLLRGHDVIISNNAFLSKELLEFGTYFTTVNYLVAEQSSHHINRLKTMHKVLPYWMAYCLSPDDSTYLVDAVGRPEFSTDIFKNMSWRHTVTFFNLHLAYGLGYRKVVMIGFDHNYKQPKGVVEQAIIQSYEEDENHFHPSYFRGKKWQAADVDMMEEMYSLAKEAFEKDGRVIVNATVGGKLELFPRMSLAEALADGSKAAAPAVASAVPLVGPYTREQQAHWDETEGVAELYSGALKGRTMVDVGAHTGTALAPFLDRGWRVFAFEPDEKNRAKLLVRLAAHPQGSQVTVDVRCVGNKSQQGLPFYRSEQSTGISGLSAFHESHQVAQTVDLVSLSDFFADRPMPQVDFLKIDTEGHDLFVLQGFPWDRARPAVIECEFEDAKTKTLGYTYSELADFLVAKGYAVYLSEWHPIVRYGIRHQWNRLLRYPCALSDANAWGNLLAFRDPIADDVLAGAVRHSLTLKKQSLPGTGADVGKRPAAPPPAIAAQRSDSAVPSSSTSKPFKVIVSRHFTSGDPPRWRYVSDAQPQHLWQAIYESEFPCAGRTLVGCLKVTCSRDLTVDVSLARHGSTAYEGSTTRCTLVAGTARLLHVRHTFQRDHDRMKVQLEVAPAANGFAAEFDITFVSLAETVGSMASRRDLSNLGITLPNQLYREQKYRQALALYLTLYGRRGLRMYLDNAAMAARKLGVYDTSNLPELAKLLE